MTDYQTFLASKQIVADPVGFDTIGTINPLLFDWQRDMVHWATMRGRAALFERYGLGKTAQLLAWSDQVLQKTNKPVLVLSPLGAAKQTAHIEAPKFNYTAKYCWSKEQIAGPGIYVTNYEKLHLFDPSVFGGVVLDEASIMKDFSGKTRNLLMEMFRDTSYKLLCTATPAPNDYVELGNYAQFLGIMSYAEMLSTFFEHDGGDTSKWKMMAWGEKRFWEWLASWAMLIRSPSDLDYSDEGYNLPPLHLHTIDIPLTEEQTQQSDGAQLYLFPVEARGLSAQRNARKVSMNDRVKGIAERVNNSTDQWIVWGETNAECDLAMKMIRDSVQVAGRDTEQHKEDSAVRFVRGDIRVLISKASIFGHGLNWQHCHEVAYLGWSNSFEQFDQSLHRVHRYGQANEVNVYIATTDFDGAIVRNIERKRAEYDHMMDKVIGRTRAINSAAIHQASRQTNEYQPSIAMRLPAWLGA
jgi:hypothetical protein